MEAAESSETLVCYQKITRVYSKVSGLAVWSESYKWYSSLPLGAVVKYTGSQSSELCRHNPLCCFATSVCYYKHIRYFGIESVRKRLVTLSYTVSQPRRPRLETSPRKPQNSPLVKKFIHVNRGLFTGTND